MNINITGLGLTSPNLQSLTEEKLEKLAARFPLIHSISINISKEHQMFCITATLGIKGGNKTFNTECNNAYTGICKLTKKMHSSLTKSKKLRKHKRQNTLHPNYELEEELKEAA